MLNFSEGFPIVPETPTAGPLRLNAYSPAQVLGAYDGDNLEFLDPSRLTDPLSYTRGDIKKVETYNQYYALTQALGTMEGNLTGVSDGLLGIANDPTKGATLRQFIGLAPLAPIRYGDSELTKEAVDADLKSLNMMLEAEEGVDFSTLSYDQLSDRQKQIRDLSAKITYAEARNKATEKLGFDWIDQMMAQDVFGLTGYLADKELAGDTQDIEKVLNREDPNFDSQSWFNTKFSNEIVAQYLLENGITNESISDSPNADHAMMRIMSQLNTTDIQRRMNTYTPTTADKFRLLRDTFVGGMINSPDTIPSAVAELGLMALSSLAGSLIAPGVGTVGGAVVGAGAASAVTTALGGTSLFVRLKRAYDAATFTGRALRATAYATETLYKLPLGIMPSYVANFGLLRGAAASFTFGAVQGGLSEYARQKREIAFGAATLYANPNAMLDYNASMMASTALESGALFGGVFGLGGGLLRSGVGALNNRMSGVLIDPKTGFRNIEDKRFTLESTPLGNSIDNIRGLFNRRERALIDAPVIERATMESAIENTEVTPEKLAADTEARVDRVETREAARSPDAARATPEDAGTRRYEGETIPEYIARVAPNRAVRNIFEAMTEFARRTVKQGSERFIEAGEQFDQMSIQDQMRVLFNGKKMLEDSKKAETDAVGLPRERERVYDELEKSRSAWFGRLKKKLTKEEFKAIKAEFEQGKKKSTRNLPELLKEARNTAKPAAERKADSDELSVRLLEAVRSAAVSPDRESTIKPEVPAEVLDSFDAAVIEHKLTGNISEETAEALKRDIAGVEAPTKVSKVSKAFDRARKAIITAKLDKDRVRKIKAVIKDPEKFVDLIEGNKNNATKFFDYINELVFKDMISIEDRDLLLASTVHLNFSSNAFNIEFTVDRVLDLNNKAQPDVIGVFRRSTNSITMNVDFVGSSAAKKTRRAQALLHELGHAYFAHEASGGNYLQALRLYNQSVLGNTTQLMRIRPETPDPLLNEGFLSDYHMQNAEEVFVQTFSKILLTEAEAAIGTLTPMQVSRLQYALDKIATSVTLAATMFDNSTHYRIAKEIIDSITEVETKVKTFISMPTLARAYGTLHKLIDTVEDAVEYNKALDAALKGKDAKPFHLTQTEVNILRNAKKDPGFIIALSIMKADGKTFVDTNGNLTKGAVDLVKAYKEYKQAQFTSMQVKVAYIIGSNLYKTLKGMDKFDRLEIIKTELFSIYSKEYDAGIKPKVIMPATYEDIDVLKNLDTMDYLDPTGESIPYAVGFFGTNGSVLIEALNSIDSTGKAITPDSLSAAQKETLIKTLREDSDLNMTLIDKLRMYLDGVGLPELADVVTEAHHKSFIETLLQEGIFDLIEDITQTLGFKTWFGNSKVVDSNGRPLVVYHGTSKDRDFNKFKIGKRGAWFTTNPEYASEYAMQNDSQKIKTEFDATTGRLVYRDVNTASRVIPVYLKLENPAKLTKAESEGFQLAVNYGKYQADLFDKYKRMGHDGVDFEDGTFVVFEPTQIKSKYNSGTFNPTDADIRREIFRENTAVPQWPNKEVAQTTLALMLKQKLDIEQIKVLLKANIAPSMYTFLIKQHKTPKKLIGAVNALLDEDGLSYNEDSGLWGLKSTKSKSTPVADSQKVALSFNTTPLTKDNLVDVVTKIITNASKSTSPDDYFIDAAGSMIIPKISAEEKKTEIGKKSFSGNLDLILSKIEKGELPTVKDLIGYIHTTAANNKRADVQESSLSTQDGDIDVQAGTRNKPATAAERIDKRKKVITVSIMEGAVEYNKVTNGRLLTEVEAERVAIFVSTPVAAQAAKKLNVSASTAKRYRAQIEAKLAEAFGSAGVNLGDGSAKIAATLNKHFDNVEAKVKKTKPTDSAAVIKKVAESKPKQEKNPVDSGALMGQAAAIAEKLKNKKPTPVPVPTPKDSKNVLYRVTDEVTGNNPDNVLRTGEQADAMIQGSSTANKEAVEFIPKRPLRMEVESSTELSKQPEKLAAIMRSADRLGMDALVFKDGSMIPVKIEDVKPIGETVIKKEPDAEPTVVITTDNKKPVLSVISKERKPQPKKQDFPVKVEKKKVPKKKPQPKAESKPTLSSLKKELISSFKTRKERIESLVNRGYVKVFGTGTNATPFVMLEDRLIVVLNIKGKEIPFYISTGLGGKKDVASGQWYPFFGMTEDGSWFIKLTGKEINNVYGSPELREAKALLDEAFGNLDNEMQDLKFGATIEEMRAIRTAFYQDTGLDGGLANNKEAVTSLSILLKKLNTSGIKKGGSYKTVKAHIDSIIKQINEGKELEAPPTKSTKPSTPRIPLPPKKEVPVEKTESEVVKTPEADRVERKVNEDPKLLRQSGMDVGFLKNFLKKYWESKIEADGGETMTPMFKQMWSHFVNVNQFIADANKRILGDDIMDKFWAAVDRIKANELRLKVTEGPGSAKKLKSYRQILEQAAKEVAVEGKPDFVIPVLPDEVKFIKTDEAGNYRMSARSKKTKAIIDTAGEDPVIAGPPKTDAVLRDPTDTPAADTPVAVEAEPPTPKEQVIGSAINQTEAGASRLMRLNNLVGWVFGGNQRESRSWWENLMNKGANATQSATGLGNTLRSTVDALAFVSRFFDDTKTQTGHLVGAGKTAFKTATQLRAEEGRLMTRIFREYARMHNIVPRMTNVTKAALDMYVYESLFLNRQPNKADLVALGIPAYKADEVAKQASMVLRASRIANRNVLDLENQTGRMSIVDENGNPVSSDTYAPVQLDHEGLTRLDQGARSKLLAAMVQARTNRKLKDPTLDINTMIAMGWLDVAYDEDAKTLSIFTPDRVFKHAEMANMFSNETLQKLFVADMAKEGITGNKSDIVRLLRKNQQEKFFVLETDTKYIVYRVPEKVTDLAPADKAKYIEAINGNTAMYTEKWRTKLNGKNLIEVEMKEMLKFKTKQYPYNNPDDFNSITKQPFFKIDPDGKTILPIKGLTPEEMLSSPETKAILRTNMAESYFYFLKGRYFELAFQKELDRMFGQTGITILDVFDYVEKTGYENFDTIAKAMNWTPQELSNAQKGLAEGLKRLREEYQFNADTLPYLNSEVGHSARIGLAAIRFKFSAGYGISAMTETLAELAKQSPEFYMIPVNVIKALRYVLADYRFSKRKLLESDIGDMTFVLENFRTDLANRFMGEIGYGAFKSDSRLDTKIASTMSNIKDAQGGLETATRTFEEAGKWMQSIGSLQAVTNGTRALAKQRIQRMLWKYISKGKIEALFDALEETATAAELAELKKAAATDSRAEAKLWKKFASVARHQAKFGDPNEAALFLKYGLTTKEQIRHLKWAMEKAGHKEGRINIINLMDIHEDLKDNPVDGINPDILDSAVSAYAHMVEDLIIKTSTSELKGLNKLTSLDSRSALGRMWYALTSWVRSYQDNVVMDYGSRSTIKYIASGIFLYAALDTMIGLFKEWLAGRETEDMMKELEEQPGQYVLRGVSRVPFLGIANGLIESGVSTVAGMTGGTYKYYGVPLLPAGAGAGMGAIETDYKNIQKVIQDPISARSLKATSDLFGATSLVNRSPIAIPVRMLEDMNTFKEIDAIQRYLDMVQRDPYPYSKRSESQFKPIQLDYTTTPRNYAMEQRMADEAMQREMGMRQTMPRPESNNTFPMAEDQKGVSGRLGELLD